MCCDYPNSRSGKYIGHKPIDGNASFPRIRATEYLIDEKYHRVIVAVIDSRHYLAQPEYFSKKRRRPAADRIGKSYACPHSHDWQANTLAAAG
jgi:hypothetical protein